MLNHHDTEIRVRYQETDGQGRVHHANFFTYFEQARVEQLRAAGYDYRRLEAEGYLLVVAEISCEFYLPASFDDLLSVRTITVAGARVEHRYEVRRGNALLAVGRSVVACVTRSGRVTRLPKFLLPE